MATKEHARMTRAQHAHINTLFAKHGNRLTREELVKDALASDSPIHDLFTWNNRRAAHLYRLQQAARILRTFVSWIPTRKPQASREVFGGRPLAYKVKPSPDEAAIYVKAANALEDEYMYRQVVASRIETVKHSMKGLLSIPVLEPLYNKLLEDISQFENRYYSRKTKPEESHVRK